MSEVVTDGLTPNAPELIPAVPLPRGPGKPKGYPKPPTSGRKPGQRNRRSIEAVAAMSPLLPKAKRALREMLVSSDPATRVKAAGLVLAYVYGHPVARREVTGAEGEPLPPSTVVNASNNLTVTTAARAILGVLGVSAPAALKPVEEPAELPAEDAAA